MNNLQTNFNTQTKNCEIHGDYESKNYLSTIWTQCPKCVEESDKARALEEEKKEEEQRNKRWFQYVESIGIPLRFSNKWLGDFVAETPQQKNALAFAEDYVSNFEEVLSSGRNGIFVGKAGTGKTHLAAAICLNVINGTGKTAIFTTVMRAIRKVKETWKNDSDTTETQAIKSFVSPDLLVLDEVGVQFGSDTEKLILFDIINERYEKKKPTILISNLTTTETKEYLGERIYDRLREGGGRAIKFDWESHRGKSE